METSKELKKELEQLKEGLYLIKEELENLKNETLRTFDLFSGELCEKEGETFYFSGFKEALGNLIETEKIKEDIYNNLFGGLRLKQHVNSIIKKRKEEEEERLKKLWTQK